MKAIILHPHLCEWHRNVVRCVGGYRGELNCSHCASCHKDDLRQIQRANHREGELYASVVGQQLQRV